jgi:hypothetical protein
VRLALLSEVREQLWLSFEERMRLWGDTEQIMRKPPRPEAGLGPERGYFNLAGVHLAVAKARYATGKPDGVEEDLAACERVYRDVATLRKLRYANRPHPHHAACVNGFALVDYHRVTLLGDKNALPRAYESAVAALRERWMANETGDVRKSTALLVKIALAGSMATAEKDRHGTVGKAIVDALAELTKWLA